MVHSTYAFIAPSTLPATSVLDGGNPATYRVGSRTVLASQFVQVAYGVVSNVQVIRDVAGQPVAVTCEVGLKGGVSRVYRANRAGFANAQASGAFYAALKAAEANGWKVYLGGAPGAKSGQVLSTPDWTYFCSVRLAEFKLADF